MERTYIENMRYMTALLVHAYDLALEHMPEGEEPAASDETTLGEITPIDSRCVRRFEADALDAMCAGMSGDDCRALAKHLGMHSSGIYNWRTQGRVPQGKREDFNQWLLQRSP